MNIADELTRYDTAPGPVCRVAALATMSPNIHADLMEALASSATHRAVARWWNATRAEQAALEITDQTVARHRRKACVACR